MPRINEHYLDLKASYLFAEIKRRTEIFAAAHPAAVIISLSATSRKPPAVVSALQEAAREQGHAATLRGYGPYAGYEWLSSGARRFSPPLTPLP